MYIYIFICIYKQIMNLLCGSSPFKTATLFVSNQPHSVHMCMCCICVLCEREWRLPAILMLPLYPHFWGSPNKLSSASTRLSACQKVTKYICIGIHTDMARACVNVGVATLASAGQHAILTLTHSHSLTRPPSMPRSPPSLCPTCNS